MEDTEIKSLIEETKNKLHILEEELLKREEKKSRFPKRYMTENRFVIYSDGNENCYASENHCKHYRDYEDAETQKALHDFKYETFTRLMERIVKAFNTDENGKIHEVDWNDINQNKYRLYYNFACSSITFEYNNKHKHTKNSLYCVFSPEEFTVKNIVRELNKEGYTQADLEWWLKY